jgi:hypothetical protein
MERTKSLLAYRELPLLARSGLKTVCRPIVSSEPKLPDVQSRESRQAIAMCGRLSVGKSELNGSAALVGAAMCSTC